MYIYTCMSLKIIYVFLCCLHYHRITHWFKRQQFFTNEFHSFIKTTFEIFMRIINNEIIIAPLNLINNILTKDYAGFYYLTVCFLNTLTAENHK